MLLTLFNKERYEEYYRSGFWRDDTVYSLVKGHAQRAPDSIAVRTAQSIVTYRELLDAADSFASDLVDKGLIAGQRVGLWLPSRIETAVALVACSRNGFVCCPSLHRAHTAAEVAALLTRMRAAAVVAEEGYGAGATGNDALSLVSAVGSLKHVYWLKKGRTSGQTIALKSSKRPCEPAPSSANRVLYLAFTSGTTGQPKGVMHSDNTLLANARALSTDWHISASSVVYSMSPLSHNLGFGAMIMALLVGGQIVVHDLPRGESLVDRLIDTGTTFLVGVPTHAIDLLSEVKTRNLPGIGKLKGFRISGASAPREVVRDLLNYGIVPQSGYGMTETCSHQYTLPDDDPRLIVESCGKSCPGYAIRIFRQDNPDLEVPASEIGEIGGRGASLMLGYFNDQAATEDSFNRDGWFMTGDLGWVDENGYLRVTGRKKDVIIRGGHNIYPAHIEALASRHDAIKRVVAVPIPDPRLGEKVCLAVMLHPGKIATAEEILRHLDAAGLSKYDMPEYYLQVDDIPLTASGKVRKRDVLDWIAEGRVHPTAIQWQTKVG
jgi:acyl-CoA synthetase (AMP-forming)/AMP-acid ligase II